MLPHKIMYLKMMTQWLSFKIVLNFVKYTDKVAMDSALEKRTWFQARYDVNTQSVILLILLYLSLLQKSHFIFTFYSGKYM